MCDQVDEERKGQEEEENADDTCSLASVTEAVFFSEKSPQVHGSVELGVSYQGTQLVVNIVRAKKLVNPRKEGSPCP